MRRLIYNTILISFLSITSLQLFAQMTIKNIFVNGNSFPGRMHEYDRGTNTPNIIDSVMFGGSMHMATNDDYLFSGGGGSTIYKHDATTYSRLDSIDVPDGVNRLAVKDSSLIVLTWANNYIELFNANTMAADSIIIVDTIPTIAVYVEVYNNAAYIIVNEFIPTTAAVIYKLNLISNTLTRLDSVGVWVADMHIKGSKLYTIDGTLNQITEYNLLSETIDNVSPITGPAFAPWGWVRSSAMGNDALYFYNLNFSVSEFNLLSTTVTDTDFIGYTTFFFVGMSYDLVNDELHFSEMGFPLAKTTRFNISGAIVDSFKTNGASPFIAFQYDMPVGLDELVVKEVSKSKIYPNPFNENATIEFEMGEDRATHDLVIYDITGNKVYEQEDINSGEVTIYRNGLKSGLYFYEIKEGNKMIHSGKITIH